jgi:hypothetical protein
MPNYGGPVMPPPPPEAKGSATTVLVLGIISILCSQLAGPVAWYLGDKELKAIRAGMAPASGEGTAKAGMIMGIIASILFVIGIIMVVFFGGLGILGGIMGGQESF